MAVEPTTKNTRTHGHRFRVIMWLASAVALMMLTFFILVLPGFKEHMVMVVMNLFVLILVMASILTMLVLLFTVLRFLHLR